MDDIVIRSMLKWPDVPDVYGWLSLDRRGNWRILNASTGSAPLYEPIGNAALREFIARNYAPDARGCWYFQNGPQRVFVELAYAPFVFRLEGGGIVDHCGRAAGRIKEAWLDEEGSLVLNASNGVGGLDDRDLGAFAGELAGGMLPTSSERIPVGRLDSRKMEERFGFVRHPLA